MVHKYIFEVDQLIKQLLIEEKLAHLALFGIGRLGKEFLKQTSLRNLIQTELYDNDSCKNGKGIADQYRISLLPETIPVDTLLVITTYYDRVIADELERKGITNWCSLPYLLKVVETCAKINHPQIKACMIEATSFCNARCVFCKNPTLSRKKQHMSEEVFERIIYRLKNENYSPERFSLHLLGEPLLDPNIFQKIKRLKEEFPNSKVGYTTNANCMNSQIINHILASGQDYMTISINAIDEEEYRQLMGLEYERTIGNITLLLEEKKKRKSDIEITMSIVASAEQEDVITRFSQRWGGKGVYIRVMNKGEWLKDKGYKYTVEEGLLRKYAQGGISCPMLLEELTVFSNGDYALCCFDSEGALNMGNVRDTSIEELYGNAERKQLIYSLIYGGNSVNLCRNCSFTL